MSVKERSKVPLTLLEARNAMAIAEATGAQEYAPDALAKARVSLDRANSYFNRDRSAASIGTEARAATQAAEDARVLSIRKKEDKRVAADRRAAEEQTRKAQEQALNEQSRAQAAREQALQAQQEAQQAQQQKQAMATQARRACQGR
jgi:hypothetical protein